MQLWNMTSRQKSGDSIISCYFTWTISKCHFTWLIWLASGQSTSIGWDEGLASRLSALFKCSEMKLESTFHSGYTLCKVSCRSCLQNKIRPTCLRNQRVSLIRCDTPKGALTRNNDLSHLRNSIINHRKSVESLHILESQSLHWDKDRSTIPSSWYLQTFKSPKSLHINAKKPDTYHMWATSWLWVVATCFFACRSAFFESRRNAFVRPVIKPQFSIAPDNCMAGINGHWS